MPWHSWFFSETTSTKSKANPRTTPNTNSGTTPIANAKSEATAFRLATSGLSAMLQTRVSEVTTRGYRMHYLCEIAPVVVR